MLDLDRIAVLGLSVSVLGWMAAETAVFVRAGRVDSEGAADHDHGTVTIVLLCGAAAFVLGPLIAWLVPSADFSRVWTFTLGIALLWIGVAFRLWSVLVLDIYFQPRVTIRTDHELVSAGPYALIRHPSYTGAMISFVGLGLALGNALGLLVILAVTLAGYLPRIAAEEQALAVTFGEEFDAYAERTSRLLPGVW